MEINEVIQYWQNLNINSYEQLELALQNYNVLFAYNSGKIENEKITFNDTREIFDKGKVINYTGDLRTLYEIQNQKNCSNYLLKKIIKKEPISIEFIKKVNKLLCQGTIDERRYIINGERAGEFKKHDYVVGINEVGSSPEDVISDLKHLIEEVNLYSGNNYLTVAAYLHCNFEYIHPFSDGNGRTGRTLLNYYLMINDLPPTIIYEEDKKSYYDALKAYDEQEDISIMRDFIEISLIKTWQKTLEKTNEHRHMPDLEI